jgi:hypothetical protein
VLGSRASVDDSSSRTTIEEYGMGTEPHQRRRSTLHLVVRFLTIMVCSAALTFVIGSALLSRS